MKRILINESQFKLIFEGDAPGFDESDDTKEYSGSEISTTSPIHDEEGNLEKGIEVDTDEISNFRSLDKDWRQARNRM